MKAYKEHNPCQGCKRETEGTCPDFCRACARIEYALWDCDDDSVEQPSCKPKIIRVS